jgi:hypothetical protein
VDHPELSFRLRAVPAAVFVDLLRQAGEPLTARALKERLAATGVDHDSVDAAWRRAQPGVRRHANIQAGAGRYAWSDVPVPVDVPRLTPAEALERILRPRLPAAVKHALAEQVRRALDERDTVERQLRAEAARALAEVAAYAGGPAEVLVERVRELVKTFDPDMTVACGESGLSPG